MATHRVYSPNNEPFDVTEARRDDLVLNRGWTQTPQIPTPAVRVQPDRPRFFVEEEAELTDAAVESESESEEDGGEADPVIEALRRPRVPRQPRARRVPPPVAEAA